MSKTAKVFKNGRSQAVRIPAEFRFNSDEVFIRRDHKTGEIILTEKTFTWDDFFERAKTIPEAEDFLKERLNPAPQERDLFND